MPDLYRTGFKPRLWLQVPVHMPIAVDFGDCLNQFGHVEGRLL